MRLFSLMVPLVSCVIVWSMVSLALSIFATTHGGVLDLRQEEPSAEEAENENDSGDERVNRLHDSLALLRDRNVLSQQRQRQRHDHAHGLSPRMLMAGSNLRSSLGNNVRLRVQRESRDRNSDSQEEEEYIPDESAVMCASRQGTSCAIHPCKDAAPLPLEKDDMQFGFLTRDPSLRGIPMQTSGMAVSGSGCALSRKYKFLYIHVLKSGGMTLKAFLKNALCGTTEMPCPMGGDVLQIVDCGPALRQHPNYFVWSFVRNPFSRLYSGYAMAESSKRSPDDASFSFGEFAQARRVQRQRMSQTSTHHYLPQANFLFDSRQCPVFDFVGRLERFQHDLRIIVDRIKSPELKAYVRACNGTVHHETNTAFGKEKKETHLGGNLRNAYVDPQVVLAVAREFAVDFSLLRYDNSTVPVN